MSRPLVAVYLFPGTNCHEETSYALELVGLEPVLVVATELFSGEKRLTDCRGHVLAGGFSYGDHFRSGGAAGLELSDCLSDQLMAIQEREDAIIGICNGFQILLEAGLLPSGRIGQREVALVTNACGVFQSQWVNLRFSKQYESPLTTGLDGRVLRLPAAHGEGQLEVPEGVGIKPCCFYVDDEGGITDQPPWSPNGSRYAGIVDGMILGMMPHPERAFDKDILGSDDGLLIFRNLAKVLKG